MRVGIYIRVSTDEQVDGYSIAAQERACRDACAARGWKHITVYADEGVSAFKDRVADRPNLKRLIDDTQNGRITTVVVHKLDRFFRRASLMLQTVERFEQHHIGFLSVTENIDLTTPHGRALFQMQAVFAEMYSRNLSFETRKGLREKAQRGDWVGPVLYGYVRDEKTLALRNDDTTEAARLLFTRFATGQESLRSVADVLNAHGYRTDDPQTGKRGPFGRETVRAMLKNPGYAGMVRCKDLALPGRHPALITMDTWQRCQEILQQRNRGGRGLIRDGWLLTRIIRCAACGAPMWTHPSAHNRYYVCSGRDHRTCDAKMVRADVVEQQALEMLRTLAVPADWHAQIIAEAERAVQPQRATPAITPQMIQEQLRRLALVFANGDLDEATYTARRAVLLDQLAQAQRPAQTCAPDIAHAVRLLRDFSALLDVATARERRDMLRHLAQTFWLEAHRIAAWTPSDLYAPMAAAAARGGEQVPDGCSFPVIPSLPTYWLAHQRVYRPAA